MSRIRRIVIGNPGWAVVGGGLVATVVGGGLLAINRSFFVDRHAQVCTLLRVAIFIQGEILVLEI